MYIYKPLSCNHSRGHNFCPNDLKFCTKIGLANISVEFVNQQNRLKESPPFKQNGGQKNREIKTFT